MRLGCRSDQHISLLLAEPDLAEAADDERLGQLLAAEIGHHAGAADELQARRVAVEAGHFHHVLRVITIEAGAGGDDQPIGPADLQLPGKMAGITIIDKFEEAASRGKDRSRTVAIRE